MRFSLYASRAHSYLHKIEYLNRLVSTRGIIVLIPLSIYYK